MFLKIYKYYVNIKYCADGNKYNIQTDIGLQHMHSQNKFFFHC